mmetsp:Transcript_21927/g.52161  ORF Transcript_21927/g.52161 Transcript_21927/m.52161 type:complete len:209 (-) Transcript_21927:208-834(-)
MELPQNQIPLQELMANLNFKENNLEGRTLRWTACQCLYQLSTDPSHRTACNSGAVKALAEAFTDVDVSVAAQAARAAWGLVMGSDKAKSDLYAQNGIAGLVGLLKRGDDTVRAQAAGALAESCHGHTGNKELVGSLGGIGVLVAQLRGTTGLLRQGLCRALCNSLTRTESNIALASEAGAVEVLALLCGTRRSERRAGSPPLKRQPRQ